jgi:hypothetical protein
MFPALFRGELAGQLTRFGGQTAAGRFVRVVELLWRGALWLSHNELNLPLPAGDVNSGRDFAQRSEADGASWRVSGKKGFLFFCPASAKSRGNPFLATAFSFSA